MKEEQINVHARDGKFGVEEFKTVLDELGTPITGSLYAKIDELRKERAGKYSTPQEAVSALVSFMDSALSEVVTSLVAIELAAKSDGQKRSVTVNLIED
ncbi:hypothetical protein [Corynebacterium stationis]|uniref:hypothetical protein n=1 Tax=Corynebacterium stationis TaxID=1705 RepID=UPI00076F7A3B|nr:hypothetical protein [Corynebacterium stationis]AMJ43663.1 hypothetical protein AW169_01115 [Corynebacterium stationis]AQX70110.1 hypothetical protein CA21670_00240 [Corynebacterium stationis]ASJ17814.1 hypothetical protein BA700_01115 [Corynebacterium stationis]HJG64006.1 hypothetical protein [Corynebacterium stationis]